MEEGLITEEEITTSAERLMTTRYLLGLFEGSEYDKIPYEVVECKEHIEAALDMARKGSVLLKNDGVLPLDKTKLQTIGVIGPNANSRAALIEITMVLLPDTLQFWKGFRMKWETTCGCCIPKGVSLQRTERKIWHGHRTGFRRQ